MRAGTTLNTGVPAGLEGRLIQDNYGTHKVPAVKQWLAAQPRTHLRFTPTGSSWSNLVGRSAGSDRTARERRGGRS